MKKIIIILLLLLLCGCNINYDLYITKDLNFTEKISFNGYNYDDLGEDDEFIKEYFGSQIEYYENYDLIENVSRKGNFEVVVKSKTDSSEEFLKLESLNAVYNDNEIYLNENGNYVFSLKRVEMMEEEAWDDPINFNIFEIFIYSEKKIINSNADKIRSNKYIWEMQNSIIKDIYFELTDENAFIIPSFIWFILVFLLIGLLILLLRKKAKKSNEI